MKKGLTILAFLYFAITCMAQSVVIGTQEWMSRNLDVEYYRNGDLIPQVTDAAAWRALKTGAWCYYNNDSTQDNKYGKLYNWYAVKDPRGLAPEGWHIPSDAEWTTLETFLGGPSVAGGKMKSTGNNQTYPGGLWAAPNTDATNTSGFTGLPGGSRITNGTFCCVTTNGGWWSATENDTDTTFTWDRNVIYFNGNINRFNVNKRYGISVRCLKD